MQSPRMKKMFVLARELRMDDEERLDFAGEILQRDVESWSDLEPQDVERVLDALHGVQAFQALLLQRVRVPARSGSGPR